MKPFRRLTIFGRTFLLMLAALAIAVAVGVTLLLTRPPMHNAPVRLSEIARQLSGPGFGSGIPPGMGPGMEPGMNPRMNPREEGRGPPPGPPPGMRDRGPPRHEWQITGSREAPVASRISSESARFHVERFRAAAIS